MESKQLTLAGFDNNITARQLAVFLFDKVHVIVWRCRLKKSWTPPGSFPDFQIENVEELASTDDYEKVLPHAFVHFGSSNSVVLVQEAARHGKLGKNLIVRKGRANPFSMKEKRVEGTPSNLTNVCLDVGTLVSQDELVVSWKGPSQGITFCVDPFDDACKFLFQKKTAFAVGKTKAVINCEFKVEFLVRDIKKINCYKDPSATTILLQLSASPLVYYRTADDDFYSLERLKDDHDSDNVDDDDPWVRTTDFTCSSSMGRCSSYRMAIPAHNGCDVKEVIKFFKKCQVPLEWSENKLSVNDEKNFRRQMIHPFSFYDQRYVSRVPFGVLFLLNCVIQKGIFNPYQLDELFDVVNRQTEKINLISLRQIYSHGNNPIFDACSHLEHVHKWVLDNPYLLKDQKESSDTVEVRRIIISPTRAYCLPPEIEISNRVLRHCDPDRFVRVTFMDEGMQPLYYNALSSYYNAPIVKTTRQPTLLSNRVRSILKDGFDLCGRKYRFLAYSGSQLKDRTAWFFADGEDLSASNIRTWMGKFTNLNVAKCAARMGLCFSSTYATVAVSPSEVIYNFPEIERNGYVFSDGIGIISEDLAKKVAAKLQLTDNPPSAYQIRFDGCKGVVARWPDNKKDKIQLRLRPSMKKFESEDTNVEVCSWTRFQPAFLNRQIILLLSALGVPDNVFLKMQDEMVCKLDKMMVDASVALKILTSCADEGNTSVIMLRAGFRPQTEPHLRSMLTCIRAAQLGDLREKARIFVPSGRLLMGCLDELSVLEQGQCFVQASQPCPENCILKHAPCSSKTENLQVVRGIVIVGKNPCLHPGDIRVLEAVDVPQLHHLIDCVVFPQKGDRPHTDEASGSDLDGDLYFVAWEKELIPPSKRSWPPMDYTPAQAKEQDREVTHEDLIEFFTNNMANDILGSICNAHVAHADGSAFGALDRKCLELAKLAAEAVDFPKTGILVTMPRSLKPEKYPDFMGKPKNQSYTSDKILGILYKQIISNPSTELDYSDDKYDPDLSVPGSDKFIKEAWDLKCSYVRQVHNLLAQYKLNQESEMVTGFVWSISDRRKSGEVKEKMKHSYNCLKRDFRKKFDELGPLDQPDDGEKDSLYEKKASAWYHVCYSPEWVKQDFESPDRERHAEPILSFAWIPCDHLARIKKGKTREGEQ